jgi:phosphate transport system substrate-binding protein
VAEGDGEDVDIIYRSRLIGGAVLATAGALALSACGSDNNSSPSTPGSSAAASSIVCSNGSLTSSGSTAQANAMSEWIKAYQTKCSGATINYGGGGSGQGVSQFTAGSVNFAGSDFPLNSEQQPAADKRCGTGNAAPRRDRDRLQPARLAGAAAVRRHPREDLLRDDHQVE